MKKVIVLLSTYNGEKFICEQVNSILYQSYSNIEIIIRDDGSTDSTLKVLEQYSEYTNIIIHKGKNKGVVNSYFELMKMTPDTDYYAFCDQDDVWKEDKIENAIKELRKFPNDIPLLYCSTVELVNENLNYLNRLYPNQNSKVSLGNALVQNVVLGCTAVFNLCALKTGVSKSPKNVEMHDSWMYLVCSAFGQVIFDSKPSLYYRQHRSNVIGGNTLTFSKRLKVKFGMVFNNPKKNFRSKRAKEFLNLFNENYPKKELVVKLANYNNSLMNKLRLFFDNRVYMIGKDKNIIYKISVILGHL